MSSQNRSQYSSTKFIALSDDESIANAKKNYVIWIITGTLIFCITIAYFSYKLFIVPTFYSDENPDSFNINNTCTVIDQHRNSKLKLYNPGPLLEGFKKRSQKEQSELGCEEFQVNIQTIPLIYVKEVLKKDFKNLSDFINLDLMLYYENLINKYEPKSLKPIFHEYQLKLFWMKKPEDFVKFMNGLKSNKFKVYADLLKQQKYGLDLKQFEFFFTLTRELNHWYNYLHRLPEFLSIYEQQKLSKNLENCTENNFEKFTQETQKQLFNFVFPFKMTEKKLREINGIINEWSKPITVEFYNCSVILYKKVLLLSNINEEIQRLNVSCLKKVYVFASSIIYLDEDLDFCGVNLAIVAPNWIFLKEIKINLNGVTGEEFMNETASFNESGRPGNPGGNAGDFLGIGNLREKFLLISANGGKGGKGQNGAKGINGEHDTRPDPPINRPVCVSKVNTYNNSFGQTITHYKIYSSFGCGHSGTDGGVGGIGGAGGVITLISNNLIKVTKGLKGMDGTPGKGGAGGIGGQNGCFYEALDVDDEILHQITRVKCPRENTLPSGEFGKDNYNSHGQIFLPKKENLSIFHALYQFLRFSGQDYVRNNDDNIISFLKDMNQINLHHKISVREIITEYKLLEVFDKIELYELLKEKINKYIRYQTDDVKQVLKYLLPTVLGKIMVLSGNFKFFFIDYTSYLNLVVRNIENTNEQTRELQSVSYLVKKLKTKIEEIKMNLNKIRLTSAVLSTDLNTNGKFKQELLFMQNTEHLSEVLNETKILHVVTTTIEILQVVMNSTFNGAKKAKLDDLLRKLQDNTSDLLQNANYKSNSNSAIKSTPLTNAENILQNILKSLQNNNSEKIKNDLSNFKDTLYSLRESNLLSDQIKHLLEALTDEIEHFIALYNLTEWEELENVFLESLNYINLHTNIGLTGEEIDFLKTRLVDVMVTLQCKILEHSARLSLHSFKNINTCVLLPQSRSVANFTSHHRDSLQNFAREDTFCQSHHKAVFDKHTVVGEFYFWPNAEIKNKLKNLFSGAEIILKSNINNHHVFDKNFIQFESLKLEFESCKNGNTSQKLLDMILRNFKIKMVHSGYSYYSWKGETYILISEKVNLEYSFKMQDNHEPQVYNSLYKKCKDGEIKLSPFTTWALRLLPINEDVDFGGLIPFADTVSLRLIGSGTYISS